MCVELIKLVSRGRGWEKLADVSCPRTKAVGRPGF